MIQNPIQMMQEFQRFSANFKGDPEQEVKKLLASGKITQQQLNVLQARATELQKLLGIK